MTNDKAGQSFNAMSLVLPLIFLLPTHLEPAELHELEERIPTLTYNVDEAEIVLGKVSRKQRAVFELRRLKLDTEPLDSSNRAEETSLGDGHSIEKATKRRKLNLPTTAGPEEGDGVVKVLNLAWFTESMEKGTLLPMSKYIVYEGKKLKRGLLGPPMNQRQKDVDAAKTILERAAGDETNVAPQSSLQHKGKGKLCQYAIKTSARESQSTKTSLIRQLTWENDNSLPAVPDFLHTTYSCQRPTPNTAPNAPFIEELKNIRTLRLLQGDKIGVRAYSTSISSIAAYPHKITNPRELDRLPGCGTKIAELYLEWHATGQTEEMRNAEADPKVAVLRVFHNIWGVGDINARDFYQKGWRDLDDIIEYGWQTLSRVQQIGVKYYDELQQKISREEVSDIAGIILDHAHHLDTGYEMMVVGGYRRGKQECGDVDAVLSHRQEEKTLNFVEKLVSSLEKSNYITHTLSLSTRNSERGQVPLHWKGEAITRGSGFDTLDKAMVVWRDPTQSNALHRRVDIIVSPWKTVGCAVLGWSGETTFQRDLRRYCKKEKGLKFDSSGIRNRTDGAWVDLEGGETRASSMEDAEKRVFSGLGIPWRQPWERCTG